MRSTTSPDAVCISIPEAAARLNLGRTKLYGYLTSGALRSIRLGARRVVPVAALEAFMAAQPATVPPPASAAPIPPLARRPGRLGPHRRRDGRGVR